MQLTQTALLLAILPFSLAASCTKANALDWPADNNPFKGAVGAGGGSSSSSSCSAQCGNNAACVTNCLELQAIGQCNSVGGSACDDLNDGTSSSPSNDPSDLIKRGRLGKRVALDCGSGEKCYLYTDGGLLCLDMTTGIYTSFSPFISICILYKYELETNLVIPR